MDRRKRGRQKESEKRTKQAQKIDNNERGNNKIERGEESRKQHKRENTNDENK